MLLINCKSAKENPYNCSLDVRYENGTCIQVCRPTMLRKTSTVKLTIWVKILKILSDINSRFCISTYNHYLLNLLTNKPMTFKLYKIIFLINHLSEPSPYEQHVYFVLAKDIDSFSPWLWRKASQPAIARDNQKEFERYVA